MNTFYNDKEYPSCITCNGSGYIKNFFNEITKQNVDIKNKITYNFKTYENLAPYKICLLCHGTGKKNHDIVFHYTCCLNKN